MAIHLAAESVMFNVKAVPNGAFGAPTAVSASRCTIGCTLCSGLLRNRASEMPLTRTFVSQQQNSLPT